MTPSASASQRRCADRDGCAPPSATELNEIDWASVEGREDGRMTRFGKRFDERLLSAYYSTINSRDAEQNLPLDLERAQRGMVES